MQPRNLQIHTVSLGLMLLLALPLVAFGQGTLFVEGDNVGIGTPTPLRKLDVDATGDAQANLVRLVRDGVLRYRLENSAVGAAWDFTNDSFGQFAIQKVGIPKNLVAVTGSGGGRLAIGCNIPDHSFVISPGPNCGATPRSWIDAGDTMFSITSSRSVKENLRPVDARGVLEKMKAVQVYTYDFIDGPEDRLGLVAEEFHQIFGRGSETELNGAEVQMALWLGVDELSEKNAELEKKNHELQQRLERLEEFLLPE